MKKTLYQMLSFVICIMLVASLFVGCATRNVSNGMKPSDTQTQPENIVNIDILGVDNREPINPNGDEWIDIPVKTLREADIYFHSKSFPEIQLVVNEEYISGDVKVSTNGNIIKIDVVYMDEPWTMYAARVNDLTQPINLGIPDVPTVKITHDGSDCLSFAGFAGHIAIYDNSDNNNVYVCCYQGKKLNPVIMKIVYFNEQLFEKFEGLTISEENSEVWIAKSNFDVNGESITLEYRIGMTFGEWACSELNTEGWYIPLLNPHVVVNQNDTIFGFADEPIDMWLGLKPVTKDSWYKGKSANEPEYSQYRKTFVYCMNSWSPLRIEGFAALASDSLVNTNTNFWQNISLDSGKKAFIQAKVASGDIDKLHIYIVNHKTDEYTEIPETAVELEVTLREKDNVVTGLFTADDPRGIDVHKPVDFLFTYEDEIIYYAPYYQLQY